MSNTSNPWSQASVRAARGDLSRAAFAHQIGVSPLTVYRWELPSSASQARRPRRGSLERLNAWVSQHATASAPPLVPANASPAISPAAEPPFVHLLAEARWTEVERVSLLALTSGDPLTPDRRAFLQCCLAKIQLVTRQDARGALATLAPLLSQVSALAPATVDLLHATAALVFSSPDGHVFDPVRSAGHAALVRIEAPQHLRIIAGLGAAAAAWHDGDGAVFVHRVRATQRLTSDADQRILRALTLEATGLAALVEGRPTEAVTLLEQGATLATRLRLAPMAGRMVGRACLLRLLNTEHPDTVLIRVDKARRELKAAGSIPGHAELLIGATEAEGLFRGCSYEQAQRAADVVEQISHTIQWPAIDLVLVQTRLGFHMGGAEAVDALASRFRATWSPTGRPLVTATANFLDALAQMCHGELASSTDGFQETFRAAIACGTAPWLAAVACMLTYNAEVYGGNLKAAEIARHIADRFFEKHPAAWQSVLIAQTHGMQLSLEGRADQAREIFQAAADTLQRAGDLGEAARCRRGRALTAWALEEPDGAALIAASDAELARLDILPSPAQEKERFRLAVSSRNSAGPASSMAPTSLVVPFRRLAYRGFAPNVLLQEILGAAKTLLNTPDVRLEATDTPTLDGTHAAFSDGFGHSWRLVVPGPTDQGRRTALELLATTAGLAMELATLRSGSPRRSPLAHTDPRLAHFIAVADTSRALLDDVQRVAQSRATVLIEGESGVGKELVADALHRLSPRASGPYVTFNSATTPAELFDAQLFGYQRGAFTGADRDHDGIVRAADGGTLFLDEIGDLPLPAQAKLLRFLESKEVLPLGATKVVHVDVRIVTATHRDLRTQVAAGLFREDLFYRLQVIPLRVPALRERRDDIVPLARHFLAHFTESTTRRLTADAAVALRSHGWPGNVRELRNVIERSLALAADRPILDAADLRF